MPVMDGIEATKHLRSLGYNEPIIALTANALKGHADMFLKNGFDEFMSKPIDIRQLDMVLNRWIRDKERETPVETDVIAVGDVPEGVSLIAAELGKFDIFDVDSAVSTMGGLYDVYDKTVKLTARLLPATVDKTDSYLEANDLKNFGIEIHGLKGVLRNIGAFTAANKAAQIETAALDERTNFCKEKYPPFRTELLGILKRLNAAVASEPAADKEDVDLAAFLAALQTAKTASEDFDALQALNVMKPFQNCSFDEQTGILFESVMNALEEFNCHDAAVNIAELEQYIKHD
jgi:CheY-like chemotaxis protein